MVFMEGHTEEDKKKHDERSEEILEKQRREMVAKLWLRIVTVMFGVLLIGVAQANIPTVPNELYEALKLDREKTSPKELYDAVVKRYKDPAQGAGPGTMAQYWEPIPYGIYLDPATFYKPPTSNKDVASRKECVECHTDESPVWVQAWKRSSHANLDKIRNLKPNDPTFYKKGKLEDVEKNLRSHGKLAEGEQLKEVGCIDCHVEVGAKKRRTMPKT